MDDATQALIDRIAADAAPVRPLRKGRGLALAGLAFLVTLVAVLFLAGARHGLMNGQFSVFFVVVNGLLLVLGLSCVTTVAAMAAPQVGAGHEGPIWAIAMAGVLPVAGVLAASAPGGVGLMHVEGIHCMYVGLAASVLIAAALFVWLRRGAPVSPKLAGFYLGVGSGAL
ncbi:MAG: NrsF family protein, partial [Novosphingobium sp.]